MVWLRVIKMAGAALASAFVGFFLALLSAVPFGESAAGLVVLTAVPGAVAGSTLGLVASVLPASRAVRIAVLVVLGPGAVFCAEMVWLIALFSWEPDPHVETGVAALFGSAMTMVFAIPGTTAGAFVIEALAGARVGDASRVVAFRRTLSASNAPEKIAAAALDDPSIDVRRAAVAWLGTRTRTVGLVRSWVATASAERLSSVAVQIADLACGADESLLLELLERGDWHAQRVAARRLGEVGGVAALRALEPLVAIGYLGDEAAVAVRRIRPRLPNAAPGQLSIPSTADGEGCLSPAPDAGRLSKV